MEKIISEIATELGIEPEKFTEAISKRKLTVFDEDAKTEFEKNFGKLKYDEGHKFGARNFARDLGKKLGIEELAKIEHYGEGERILSEQFKKLKVPITENEEFKAAITSYEQKLSELQKEKQSIFDQRIIDKYESEKQKAILSIPCQVPTHIQNAGQDAVDKYVKGFYKTLTLNFDDAYSYDLQTDGSYKIISKTDKTEVINKSNHYNPYSIPELVQLVASEINSVWGINNATPQGKGEGDKKGSKEYYNTREEFDKWVENNNLDPLSEFVINKLTESKKKNPNFK